MKKKPNELDDALRGLDSAPPVETQAITPWRPKSVPPYEETQVGVAPPNLGQYGPKRSYSPPPMASPKEEAAIDEMAESRGERVVRPKPSVIERVVRHEYGVDKATRAWIVTAFIGVGGVSAYGALKPGPSVPQLESLSCQQRCPLGNKQQIPRGLPPLELQVTNICCEAIEARLDAEAALSEARAARELAGKASDKVTAVEQKMPAVNP